MSFKSLIAKHKIVFASLATVTAIATPTVILTNSGVKNESSVTTPASTLQTASPASTQILAPASTDATNTDAISDQICDGKTVTTECIGPDEQRYSVYKYHDEVTAVTKEVYHPATPEKSHNVYHEPVYGTRTVKGDCIRTNISNKRGSCALSQCRDGSYSGSTGRGTCSHHGGVAKSGGPWYNYTTETYVITPGWTEKVIDEPAKAAWTETVVVTPKQEAFLETKLASEV